jgi:hypothetical protein
MVEEPRASSANYSTYEHDAFPFEKWMSGEDVKENANRYWMHLWACSAAYLVVVYALKTGMANRSPFGLRLPLILWNSCLAAFSLFGIFRMVPEMVYVLTTYGRYHSVCVSRSVIIPLNKPKNE